MQSSEDTDLFVCSWNSKGELSVSGGECLGGV